MFQIRNKADYWLVGLMLAGLFLCSCKKEETQDVKPVTKRVGIQYVDEATGNPIAGMKVTVEGFRNNAVYGNSYDSSFTNSNGSVYFDFKNDFNYYCFGESDSHFRMGMLIYRSFEGPEISDSYIPETKWFVESDGTETVKVLVHQKKTFNLRFEQVDEIKPRFEGDALYVSAIVKSEVMSPGGFPVFSSSQPIHTDVSWHELKIEPGKRVNASFEFDLPINLRYEISWMIADPSWEGDTGFEDPSPLSLLLTASSSKEIVVKF